MSTIRARQRTTTAVFPHNANRRFLIPNRPSVGVIRVMFTDDFNRANELFTASPNWALVRGTNGMRVQDNEAAGDVAFGVNNCVAIGVIPFPNDQGARATLVALPTVAQCVLMVRAVEAPEPLTWYGFSVRVVGSMFIEKRVNGGAQTPIGNQAPADAIVPGDEIKLTVVGNVLRGFVNGIQVADAVDSDIPGGQPGLGANDDATRFDDFEAGAVS